ncbi:hypothetical protein SHL15_0289 [Streptomyces hygroscopicus subsp. limoneus]|nr:hypothetical protein SHL15_0289 [Streptomyces hygroscopicus subsp. limoneus]
MLAAVDPGQPAGLHVQVGQDAGDVAAGAELLDQRRLHRPAGLGQRGTLAAGVAAGGHGDVGGDPGGGVVAHGVEDAQVEGAAGHRVVEGVAAHLVGGLHHRADGDVVTGVGGWRGEVPLHLRGHVHRLRAHQTRVGVAEGPLAQQQQRRHRRQVAQALADGFVVAVGVGPQHTQAFHTVGDGHPPPPPARTVTCPFPSGFGEHVHAPVGLAGQTARNGELLPAVPGAQPLTGEPAQHRLPDVHHEEGHVAHACHGGVVGDHPRKLFERSRVTGLHQPQQRRRAVGHFAPFFPGRSGHVHPRPPHGYPLPDRVRGPAAGMLAPAWVRWLGPVTGR